MGLSTVLWSRSGNQKYVTRCLCEGKESFWYTMQGKVNNSKPENETGLSPSIYSKINYNAPKTK